MIFLLHLLAIPLGVVILAAIFLVIGLIVTYPGESFGVLILLICVYGLGSWALGIQPFGGYSL